jgi:ribosomal protein S18 acetylase RimI-like enzyme
MNLAGQTSGMSTARTRTTNDISIRRDLRDGDADAIAELHRRVYASEYGLNERFVESVRRGVQAAARSGWPQRSGAVWLADGDTELLGALGLTEEGGGLGKVRWFVLDPSLRGMGLGRELIVELLGEARAAGLQTLVLETFSDLTAAAHIYRGAGFRVTWERPLQEWGPPVTFQQYELTL